MDFAFALARGVEYNHASFKWYELIRENIMSLSDAAGWSAMAITVIYSCIGLPAQVRKNYINKSTAGLSVFMTAVMFLTFVNWTAYALLKQPPDWYIAVSNSPGIIGSLTLLCQFRIYKKRVGPL